MSEASDRPPQGTSHEPQGGHDHGHLHRHGPGDEGRVRWALILTFSFMVIEVVGAVVSGSLALLADAGHMLADSGALALAYVAYRVARRPADLRRSYGYERIQVLASFVSGLALCAISIFIIVEAMRRLGTPNPVQPVVLTSVAALGLVLNLVVFRILHGGDRNDLNLQAATLHVLSDLLGSVAALTAGIVVWTTGFHRIDPLLSLLVAALILRVAVQLVRRTAHILLEGAPEGLDADRLTKALHQDVPELLEVHHVHAWSLTLDRPVVTLHATIREDGDGDLALAGIKRSLVANFGIHHATVQIEYGPCPDVTECH